MVEFSRDQNGSRFIQAMLESPQCLPEDKQMVFDEVLSTCLSALLSVSHFVPCLFTCGHEIAKPKVLPAVPLLTQDLFGNYVVQVALA